MKKILSICFLLTFVLCACSSNDSSDLINEYNSEIDYLLESKGFIMNVDASYVTKIVDQDHLEDDLVDEDSKLQQVNQLAIDLSKEKPNYSLSTMVQSTNNDSTTESMVVSKDNETKTYVKENDTYVEDVKANNEIDIIDQIKEMMFYVNQEDNDIFTVHKEEEKDKTKYRMTLEKQDYVSEGNHMFAFDYEMILNKKGNIEQINGNFQSYSEVEGKFQRTDYQCVMTIENYDKIPSIAFLTE